MQTLMLSTLDRRVAVVLFANTSGALAGRAFDAIFMALKAYGESKMRQADQLKLRAYQSQAR